MGLLICCINACNTNPPQKEARVYIRENTDGYQLIRNGKPFYIRGAAGKGFLKELKEAGGNTLRVYDTLDLKETLIKADSLGLAVVVDIPLPKYNDQFDYYSKDSTALVKKVANLVSEFKDHPALLYWNLGNELMYPTFYKSTNFFNYFNKLIDTIHNIDKNHPVSTAVIGGNRRRFASIIIKSPKLDFISINSFGGINDLQNRMQALSFLWNGPYVISEWGINGPWEEKRTAWNAPLEPTSTKKAELTNQRFNAKVMKNDKCLGSFAFFWGNKQERTSTWYSIFSRDGAKSEAYHVLSDLWNKKNSNYSGPRLKYALLNKKGAPSNIVLTSGEQAQVKVLFKEKLKDSTNYEWEIRKEAWNDPYEDPQTIPGLFLKESTSEATFKAPTEEGPYRIFYYIKDENNNFASTNVPFYVLTAKDEK